MVSHTSICMQWDGDGQKPVRISLWGVKTSNKYPRKASTATDSPKTPEDTRGMAKSDRTFVEVCVYLCGVIVPQASDGQKNV